MVNEPKKQIDVKKLDIAPTDEMHLNLPDSEVYEDFDPIEINLTHSKLPREILQNQITSFKSTHKLAMIQIREFQSR